MGNDLKQKNNLQSEKLNDQKSILTCQDNKIVDLQMKLSTSSEENIKLKENIKDLQKEIQDHNDMTQQRSHCVSQNDTFEMDVSMDDPKRILSPPRGETMGGIVTLQLQQDIEQLKSDLAKEKQQQESFVTMYNEEKTRAGLL